MSVPQLTVQIQGQGVVSADYLNTLVQGAGIFLANLRAFTGVSSMTVYMSGYSAQNDGGQGNFYWNTTTGTDDGGLTTVVPTGSTGGCWSRLSNSSVSYTPQTVNINAGSNTLTAANVTNQVLIRSGGATPTDTFPTASAIIGAMTGQQSGAIRDLLIINENSGTMLISPGAGVTFLGNLATGNFSMPTATQRVFKIYIASASAVTVYG